MHVLPFLQEADADEQNTAMRKMDIPVAFHLAAFNMSLMSSSSGDLISGVWSMTSLFEVAGANDTPCRSVQGSAPGCPEHSI